MSRLSDLIEQLKEIEQTFGDLKVYTPDDLNIIAHPGAKIMRDGNNDEIVLL